MTIKKNDSVMDSLFANNTEVEDAYIESVYIPPKCEKCGSAPICSILPVIMKMNQYRIKLNVEECPYRTRIKNES